MKGGGGKNWFSFYPKPKQYFFSSNPPTEIKQKKFGEKKNCTNACSRGGVVQMSSSQASKKVCFIKVKGLWGQQKETKI